jgi:uncharacterized protein YqeY
MSLQERLTEEMKQAMKEKDDLRLSVIRMVRATIKNREIDRKKVLDDQEVGEVISSLAKQRRESIRMFGEAGRTDLVEREERELALLMAFLPQQLERGEIAGLVAQAIAASGAQGVKDMGKVMKLLIPQVAGRADGKLVNDIVREQLSGA